MATTDARAIEIFRQVVLYVFYLACAAIVLLAIVCVVAVIAFIINPFAGFDGSGEFVDLSGPAARRSMNDWPAAVDPARVKQVSNKFEYTMDSHFNWYKITLDAESASHWVESVHRARASDSQRTLDRDDRGMEGVRRTISGSPGMPGAVSQRPGWWDPSGIDFRATEVMQWYSGFDSGVAQAAYTGYDEKQQTLWVYEYALQHERLWEPNKMPEGEVFSKLKD